MSDHPIVSRLETNLGWKAWLKPFFIHPSVTAGAKLNLKQVQFNKKWNERRRQKAQAQLAPEHKNLYLFGVAVSATTLAVAATVAFIAAPVAVIASRIANELSTLWTRWRAHMPLLIDVEN